MLKLYTDGATSMNGAENAQGGWAWALVNDNNFIESDSGHVNNATNNICELMAIINGCTKALQYLKPFDNIAIYSDSAYCVRCKTENWYRNWQNNGWVNSKKQPVANQNLWEQLIPFFEDNRFQFYKVKGHSVQETDDAYWNNYVDKLAVEAKKI